MGNNGDGQVSVGTLVQIITRGRAWSRVALSLGGGGSERGCVCGDPEYGGGGLAAPGIREAMSSSAFCFSAERSAGGHVVGDCRFLCGICSRMKRAARR